MHLFQWLKDNPIYIPIAYVLIGAIGELGQSLATDYPRAARFFGILSRFGTAVFSMYRLAAPKPPALPTIPEAPDSAPSTKDLGRRGSALVDFIGSLGFLGIVVAVVILLGGCGPSKQAAIYGAKLEACLQTSATCEAYIACRDGVQMAEGRGHYRATCEPSDAGADARVIDARADELEAGIAEGGAK